MSAQELASAEKKLRLVLQIFGYSCVPALGAFLMPAGWMQSIHDQMEMNAFPMESPITIYLARATSALVFMYGLATLLMASDVRRYERFIFYHIRVLAVVALAGSVLAYQAGMPILWIATDCVATIVLLGLQWHFQSQALAWASENDTDHSEGGL